MCVPKYLFVCCNIVLKAAASINDTKPGHYMAIMSEVLSVKTLTHTRMCSPTACKSFWATSYLSPCHFKLSFLLFFLVFLSPSISPVISTLRTIQGHILNRRRLSFPGTHFSFEETFSPHCCLFPSFYLLTNCSLILTPHCYHSTAGLFQGQT